jgi:SAM-dependent methyltransferase
MFKTYSDIFRERGSAYQQAMILYPKVREKELLHIIQRAELRDGHSVADIPAGGGYLYPLIEAKVKLYSIETTQAFITEAWHRDALDLVLCDTLSHIPIPSLSLDRIISLAGIHHIENQLAIYQEFHRLLKLGGLLSLADVKQGTAVAAFLNEFVHRHSSQGHQGHFLTDHAPDQLTKMGLDVTDSELCHYAWHFESQLQMVHFCQLLFGLDRADPEQILNGLEQYLGYVLIKGQYHLNWELMFVQARKRSPQSRRYSSF